MGKTLYSEFSNFFENELRSAKSHRDAFNIAAGKFENKHEFEPPFSFSTFRQNRSKEIKKARKNRA